jgi:hypothetical protein
MTRLAVVLPVFAILAVPAMAHADSRAEALFLEGRSALRAGDYGRGCAKIAEADALERTFGTQVNLGDCAERVGAWAEAWERYQNAKRLAGTERSDFVRQCLSRTQEHVAIVTVKTRTPGQRVVVDGRDVVEERPLALAPGSHTIRVDSAAGPPAEEKRVVAAGDVLVWDLAGPSPAMPTTGSSRRSAVGPGLTLAGGALVVTGFVAGAVALAGRGAASNCVRSGDVRLCPDRATASDAESAQTWAHVATGFIAAGIAVGGVGIGLWATRGPSASASVTVQGSF